MSNLLTDFEVFSLFFSFFFFIFSVFLCFRVSLVLFRHEVSNSVSDFLLVFSFFLPRFKIFIGRFFDCLGSTQVRYHAMWGVKLAFSTKFTLCCIPIVSWLALLNRGVHSQQAGFSLLASSLRLARRPRAACLYSFLMSHLLPLFFTLFTQVHLLIDG